LSAGWSVKEAQESNTMGKVVRERRAFVGNGHQGARHRRDKEGQVR